MRFYQEVLLPRLVRLTMKGGVFHKERAKALVGARGHVLEVGFGNGHNLGHYSAQVERLTGLDPVRVSEKLAREEIAKAPFPVEVRVGSAEAMPFEDCSFDSVAVTWTLCTIPDPAAALREMRRVLRPGGKLYFVEHGLSSDAGVARWQKRLNPIQRVIGGGCTLTREIGGLIETAGFRLEVLDNRYMKGLKTHTYLYRGVATPVASPGG